MAMENVAKALEAKEWRNVNSSEELMELRAKIADLQAQLGILMKLYIEVIKAQPGVMEKPLGISWPPKPLTGDPEVNWQNNEWRGTTGS